MSYPQDHLIWLYNMFDAPMVAVHVLLDVESDDRLGQQETLTFTMLKEDWKSQYLIPDQKIRWNGRVYRNTEQTDRRDGNQTYVDVYCEALWYDLQKRVRPDTFQQLGKTVGVGLTGILAGTGWIGIYTGGDATLYSLEDRDATIIQLLRSWATITRQEIEWNTVNKTVRFVDAVGDENDVPFRYGRNLLGIERKMEPPVCTRLYPFGANNLSVDTVNPLGLSYIEDYSWYTAFGLTTNQARAGFRKDQVWVEEDFLTALALYDAAVARLARLAQPVISYEMRVADISASTGIDESNVNIGDTCSVTDLELGIDIPARVVRRVRRPLRPQSGEIELEYLRPGLADTGNAVDQRDLGYSQMAVLVDSNETTLIISSGVSIWAEISLTAAGVVTPVMGATFVGTATGSGTIEIKASIDGIVVGRAIQYAFTTGQQVEISWPTFAADLGEGTYAITWTAQVVSGSGTVALTAEHGRAWVLVRGAVGIGGASSPSQYWIEELEEITPEPLSDSYDIWISSAVDFDWDEELANLTPHPLVDTNPYTIEDPIFGTLDGVGELSPPDDGPVATPFILENNLYGRLDGPGGLVPPNPN